MKEHLLRKDKANLLTHNSREELIVRPLSCLSCWGGGGRRREDKGKVREEEEEGWCGVAGWLGEGMRE